MEDVTHGRYPIEEFTVQYSGSNNAVDSASASFGEYLHIPFLDHKYFRGTVQTLSDDLGELRCAMERDWTVQVRVVVRAQIYRIWSMYCSVCTWYNNICPS